MITFHRLDDILDLILGLARPVAPIAPPSGVA